MRKEFLVLLISIIFLSGCINTPQQCPDCNATKVQPKRSAQEIKTFIGRIMDSYTDLVFSEPTTPIFRSDEKIWEEILTLQTASGTKTVKIRIYDENMSLENVYISGPVPGTFSSDVVVAKGVVKLTGKLNCSEDKIRVMEFFDLYCDPCILAQEKMQQFRNKFNESIKYENKLLMTHSYDLVVKYGYENVSRGLEYLACVRNKVNESMFETYKECVIAAYLKHKETPLEPAELESCLSWKMNDTDLNETRECVKTAYLDLNRDRALAESYSLVGTSEYPPMGTPVVVIDCQYKTSVDYAEKALCYTHPEIKECK
jgi:hypothetical protein